MALWAGLRRVAVGRAGPRGMIPLEARRRRRPSRVGGRCCELAVVAFEGEAYREEHVIVHVVLGQGVVGLLCSAELFGRCKSCLQRLYTVGCG